MMFLSAIDIATHRAVSVTWRTGGGSGLKDLKKSLISWVELLIMTIFCLCCDLVCDDHTKTEIFVVSQQTQKGKDDQLH